MSWTGLWTENSTRCWRSREPTFSSSSRRVPTRTMMTRPATVSHPGYFSILFIKMVLTVADPFLEAGRKFLCLMPIFELDYESYRVHFPEMCQCIVLKLGYFSPLVLHLLIHSKVFYFVHMGYSLKSFKIKDYKVITELLLCVILRYLLFYCCDF